MATSPRDTQDRSAEELRQDRGEERGRTWISDRTALGTPTHREQGREPVVPTDPDMDMGRTTEDATQTGLGTQVSKRAAVQVDPSTLIEHSRRLDTRAPMRYSRCVTDQVEGQEHLSGQVLAKSKDGGSSTAGVQAMAAPTQHATVRGTESTTGFPRGTVRDLRLPGAVEPSLAEDLEDGNVSVGDPKERHGRAATMAALEGQDQGDRPASGSYQQDPGESTTEVTPSDMVTVTAGEDFMELDSESTGAEETEAPTGFRKFAQHVSDDAMNRPTVQEPNGAFGTKSKDGTLWVEGRWFACKEAYELWIMASIREDMVVQAIATHIQGRDKAGAWKAKLRPCPQERVETERLRLQTFEQWWCAQDASDQPGPLESDGPEKLRQPMGPSKCSDSNNQGWSTT